MDDDFGGNSELNAMARRLRDLVKLSGGNQKVASIADVPLSTLNTIMAGKSDPRISTLKRIAPALGVHLSELIGDASDSENTVLRTRDAMIHIPLRDVFASAGAGTEVIDETQNGYLAFSRDFVETWGRSLTHVEAIRASGDSMLPTIQHNAIVLIDRAERRLIEGRIFAFRTSDGLRLKRFQRSIDGSALLVSDNRDLYAPERIMPADMPQLSVAGRAFWTGSMI